MGVRAEVRRLSRAGIRRRGDVYLQSRTGKPLRRYFPELELPPGRYVLDGELVILDADGREDFDALQNRLHPAESRVRMLAEQTPALLRAFDLLAEGKEKLLEPSIRGAARATRVTGRRPRRAKEGHCRLNRADAAGRQPGEGRTLAESRARA